MDVATELTVRYFVVFKESETTFFWKRFLKHGFSHTLAITMADDVCVVIDPTTMRNQLYVDKKFTAKDYALTYVKDGCTVVYFEHTAKGRSSPWMGVLYCVSVVLALLGMRSSLSLLTPYQLYKRLIKLGGRILTEDGTLHNTAKPVS